jgi:hypothetical protein
MLTEAQFEFFFQKAQRRTESCAEPLRTRRRLILRGMRAAWMGLTDDMPPAEVFGELWTEVFGPTPPKPERVPRPVPVPQPRVVHRGPLTASAMATDLQLRIIERLNAGARVVDIVAELGCSKTLIYNVQRQCAGS